MSARERKQEVVLEENSNWNSLTRANSVKVYLEIINLSIVISIII